MREGASIGAGCVPGKDVYIDEQVSIGANAKIQNGVKVYHGVTFEDGIFCGPNVTFTNDQRPRAIDLAGRLKKPGDWTLTETLIKFGASIGASATIVCGITIGRWAMIGAGAVVTRDVPDYGLVYGNPARLRGFVCPCGEKLQLNQSPADRTDQVALQCVRQHATVYIPAPTFYSVQSETAHDSDL